MGKGQYDKEMTEVFGLCDKDKGKTISQRELYKVGMSFNSAWTWEKCASLFAKIDINHDKSLSLQEFLAFFDVYLGSLKESAVRAGIAGFHANLTKQPKLPAAQNCSADVIWQATRNNSAFMVKRGGAKKRSRNNGGVQFSNDPTNLTATHCFRASGLANAENITIVAAGAADELKVTVKKGAESTHVYKGDIVNMARQVDRDLDGYRQDLKKNAMSKLSYVHKALRMTKAGIKKASKN